MCNTHEMQLLIPTQKLVKNSSWASQTCRIVGAQRNCCDFRANTFSEVFIRQPAFGTALQPSEVHLLCCLTSGLMNDIFIVFIAVFTRDVHIHNRQQGYNLRWGTAKFGWLSLPLCSLLFESFRRDCKVSRAVFVCDWIERKSPSLFTSFPLNWSFLFDGDSFHSFFCLCCRLPNGNRAYAHTYIFMLFIKRWWCERVAGFVETNPKGTKLFMRRTRFPIFLRIRFFFPLTEA